MAYYKEEAPYWLLEWYQKQAAVLEIPYEEMTPLDFNLEFKSQPAIQA